MARSFQEIFGQSITSVKALREEIKQLQGSFIGLEAGTEEYDSILEKLTAAQNEYTKVTKAGKQEIDAATDSIVGMEKQYRNMYNAYKLMSEEQRNSDSGRSMAAQLDELSKKLNATKQEVGNFKDNIGHYSESIIDAFSKMGVPLGGLGTAFTKVVSIFSEGQDGIKSAIGNVTKAVEGLGGQLASMGGPAAAAKTALTGVGSAMKALIANPVGATIMAIVVAFKALSAIADRVKKAINENEESQMALKEAMSAFQPVVDAVSNAFDRLGQMVVKVIGFVGDAFRKLREIRAAATDFLGITKGAKDQVKEQNELYKDLAKRQNELTKNKREYQKLNAADKAEVERLREEASETTNLEEKKRLLEEAKTKQAEIDARNVEQAKEELAILQAQSELTANDAAMNDKLAQAVANVANAEATAAQNARQFNKQLNTVTSGLNKGAGAAKNYREEAKKLYQALIEDNKTEIQKLTEKYETEKKLLIKYHYDTTLLTKKYNEDIEKVRESDRATQVERQKTTLKQISEFDRQYRDMLVKIYGEKSPQVQIFDTQNIDKEMGDLSRIIDNFATKYEDTINRMKATGTDGFGEESLKGLKAFDTEIREEIEIINERWPELQLAPPPELIAKEGDSVRLLQENYTEWSDNISKFISVMVNKKLALNRVDKENWAVVERSRSELEKAVRDYARFREDLEDLEINTDSEYAEKRAARNRKRAEEDAEYYSRLIKEEKDRLAENINDVRQNFAAELSNAETPEDRARVQAQMNAEIAKLEQDSYNYRLGLEEEFYDAKARMRDMDLEAARLSEERTKQIWEDSFSAFDSVTNSIGSIISQYQNLMKAEIDSGKLTEKEANKKKKTLENLAAVQLAVSVASITASAAASAMDVWRGYASELKVNAETAAATGPAAAATKAALDAKSLASAILRSIGIGATAASQLAAARGNYISTTTSLRDESSAGASVASVAPVQETPYTYTRTIQTEEDIDVINSRPVWVSVKDIESGLNKAKVRDEETSF